MLRQKKQYVYLICYRFQTKEKNNGYGRLFLTRTSKINSERDVYEIDDYIQDKNDFTICFVENYILVETK